jgi:hypothetical protein
MRNLLFISIALLAITALAMGPEYFSSRKWIEEHALKPKFEKKLFVGESKQPINTYIVEFHSGISLREVINATRLKNEDLFVQILRSQKKTEPVFFDEVKAIAKPSFQLKENDVIWLSTLPFAQN